MRSVLAAVLTVHGRPVLGLSFRLELMSPPLSLLHQNLTALFDMTASLYTACRALQIWIGVWPA